MSDFGKPESRRLWTTLFFILNTTYWYDSSRCGIRMVPVRLTGIGDRRRRASCARDNLQVRAKCRNLPQNRHILLFAGQISMFSCETKPHLLHLMGPATDPDCSWLGWYCSLYCWVYCCSTALPKRHCPLNGETPRDLLCGLKLPRVRIRPLLVLPLIPRRVELFPLNFLFGLNWPPRFPYRYSFDTAGDGDIGSFSYRRSPLKVTRLAGDLTRSFCNGALGVKES